MVEREMLTDERIKEVVDAIDFGTMVTADDYIYVIARAIESEIAARRTTPDREAVIEECAKIAEQMRPWAGKDIAIALRALKTAPAGDKGGA